MRDHHQYSFSKWPHFHECPHFMSSLENSAAAQRGTDEHEILEKYLTNRNKLLLGKDDEVTPLEGIPGGVSWAAKAIDYELPNVFINVETLVRVPDGSPMAGTYGYVDAHAFHNGEVYVFDYKSGSPSSVDYRNQLKGYGYALCASSFAAPGTKVHCFILYGASKIAEHFDTTFAELKEFASEMDYIITNKSVQPRRCCFACKYCAVKNACDACRDQLNACLNKNLVGKDDAEYLTKLNEAKGWIEAEIERMKNVCRASDGQLVDMDTGAVVWAIRTDAKGRMTSIDLNGLDSQLDAVGAFVPPSEWMSACTMTKASFKKLIKNYIPDGMKMKDMEDLYDKFCTFGKPAEKLVNEVH